jgi:hypothetical protein
MALTLQRHRYEERSRNGRLSEPGGGFTGKCLLVPMLRI